MEITNPIILFDGVCNFCNDTVNFVIKRDKKKRILFTALQSGKGQELLKQFNISTTHLDTFIFIENNKCYSKSTAALKVAKKIGGIWTCCYVFMLVPAFIRNLIYDFIASNRYRWFGKKNACMIPTQEVRERFL